ncbi:MAG TPA: MFS transporter [Thermoanaerobaculia bacterium]
MRRWILGATILGSTMAFIDGSVVNVALPVMQRELGAGIAAAQWIVDAYLLVLSALILAGGSLGDHLGRVRVFGAGVVLFALASLWCGLAPSVAHLIAARALQGLGAAMLVPGSLSIITAAFPQAERGRAIGTWSALTSLAMIAGPLLGGFLVQTVSWRAIFLINLPLAAVVLWMLPRIKLEHDGRDRAAIDWLGTALITIALGGITFSLIEKMALPMAIGVAALIAFIPVERRVRNPIVPLSLFRSRSFTGANVLTLLLYAALSGAMFLLPFNFIQVQGYSPLAAGAAFLPFVVLMTLLSRWSGALADRIGPRVPLLVGPLLAAAGFTLLGALPGIGGTYWTTFFPGIVVLALGMAVTVAPLTTTVMTSIDDERHAGAASGINNAIARAAGLLAIAVFGAVAVFVFARELDARLTHRGATPEVRQLMRGESRKLAEAKAPDAATRSDVQHAFVAAYRVDMFLGAALAALSAAGALVIARKKQER